MTCKGQKLPSYNAKLTFKWHTQSL